MDPAVLSKLDDGWCSLSSSDSKSLLKKYLTKEVLDDLKNKKTNFGSTLLDCVQSGKPTFKIIFNVIIIMKYYVGIITLL